MKNIFMGIFSLLVFLTSCVTKNNKVLYRDLNQIIHGTGDGAYQGQYIKLHLKNGDLYILNDNWKVNNHTDEVEGVGKHFDRNRKLVGQGKFNVPVNQIVLYETNDISGDGTSARIAALGIITLINAYVTAMCLTNPKACFGSCPTFYLEDIDNVHYSDAEGFSNAISPTLAYTDVDALNNPPISDHEFTLTMKNEALETHCVNQANILVFPRNPGQRVYHTRQDEFYLSDAEYPLTLAIAEEGDVTELMRHADKTERTSLADENDMRTREEIILTFDHLPNHDDWGLVVHFRQTLMTTYLIYSALGYMGDEVSDFFAELETNPKLKKRVKTSIKDELGDLDVYVWDENSEKWIFQGGFYETGPIAINRQLMKFKNTNHSGSLKVKLEFAKGLWRIDYVSLAKIIDRVEPLELQPSWVENQGIKDNAALELITDTAKLLISLPGDKFVFGYTLPETHDDYEIFLASGGYYLEWMRESWLEEKDLSKLRKMFLRPGKYLLDETPAYKEYERDMEQQFWDSRIDTDHFSIKKVN
ncbi:MAG: hypothetical protein JJU02_00685 [Cryomorphaceae bacterium]|nr:hypothetical protein [Cryomorphaceae bacterium]